MQGKDGLSLELVRLGATWLQAAVSGGVSL